MTPQTRTTSWRHDARCCTQENNTEEPRRCSAVHRPTSVRSISCVTEYRNTKHREAELISNNSTERRRAPVCMRLRVRTTAAAVAAATARQHKSYRARLTRQWTYAHACSAAANSFRWSPLLFRAHLKTVCNSCFPVSSKYEDQVLLTYVGAAKWVTGYSWIARSEDKNI